MLVPTEAYDLLKQGYGPGYIAEKEIPTLSLGKPVSLRRAQEWAKAVREGNAVPYNTSPIDESPEVTFIDEANKAEVSANQIMSLEDLLATSEVDLETWKVDRYTISSTNIRAWLSRREDKPYIEAANSILERIKKYAPVYKSHEESVPKGEYLFAPQIYDPHFNKRSEDMNYGVREAAVDFMAIGDAIISRALALGMSIERIVLPVGHDALHADNLRGTTTRGTEVDLMWDQRDAINVMSQAYIYLIERLAGVAPVDVIVVPGNHDRYSSYWLGKLLEAWFHNHEDVTVDASRAPRKYYRYNNNFFCLEHGDTVSIKELPGIMATESPVGFALAHYKEVWRGHLHIDKGAYIPFTEERGIVIRTLPSLCKTDDWHRLHGFVGNRRAAEALFYHEENGPAGNFPVFVDEI